MEEIIGLEPKKYPLLALLNMVKYRGKFLKKRKVFNFFLLENYPLKFFQNMPQRIKVNGKYDYYSKITNFLQIFRTEFSTKCKKSEQNEFAIRHLKQIALSFWFGKKDYNSNDRCYLEGIIEFLERKSVLNYDTRKLENRIRKHNNFTEKILNNFFAEGFAYGSSTKYLFVSKDIMDKINKIDFLGFNEKQSLSDEKFGNTVETKAILVDGGQVYIFVNPLFTKNFNNYMVLLDLDDINYVYFHNRDTFLDNCGKGKKAYLTECGIEIYEPLHHLGFLLTEK